MQERLTTTRLQQIGVNEPIGSAEHSMAAELLEARELIEANVQMYFKMFADKFGSLDSEDPHWAAEMRYLASIGRLEIESDDGVRVVGRLKP